MKENILTLLIKIYRCVLVASLMIIVTNSISASPTPQLALSGLLVDGHDPAWRDSVIQAALDDPRVQGATIGLYIEDIRTGEVLADINGDVPMIPASVTKSVTTATLLSLHDPQERFATEIVAVGTLNGNTLDGDIEIRTTGDPTIESSHFPEYAGFADSIATSLRNIGISTVTGRIVVTETQSHTEEIPLGWLDTDVVQPYGAPHQSANYADNVVNVRVPSKATEPTTPAIKFIAGSKAGKIRADRNRGTSVVKLSGRVPKRGATLKISNPAPHSSMETAVIESLKKRGIAVNNTIIKRNGKEEETTVYLHLSPTLIDISRSLMHRSDNLMAEGMLRYLSPDGSRSEALDKEIAYWQSRTVDIEGIVIEDGSGLSRRNRITPYFLADINYMMAQNRDLSPYYISLFPKAGLEGTMKNAFKGTGLEGRLAMKTGTVNGVRTLSGYLLDGDGSPSHVVVIMVNNFKCTRVALKNWIEDMVLKILP